MATHSSVMATHSSVLAGMIPWTEEPCGLQTLGSQGVGHRWVTEHNDAPDVSITQWQICHGKNFPSFSLWIRQIFGLLCIYMTLGLTLSIGWDHPLIREAHLISYGAFNFPLKIYENINNLIIKLIYYCWVREMMETINCYWSIS